MDAFRYISLGVATIKLGKDAAKMIDHIHDEVTHGGKEKFGTVKVKAQSYGLWKVEIRKTGNRGRYLKCYLEGDDSQKFRVSADGYNPEKYLQISPDEWNVFACLAQEQNNSELQRYAQQIMDRLVMKL